MLDFPGFVEFVTVVHEHVLGLQSWHQPVPRATSEPPLSNKRTAMKSRADNAKLSRSLSRVPQDGIKGSQPNCIDNFETSGNIVLEGRRAAHQGATSPSRKLRGKCDSGVAPATNQRSADTTSFEVKTEFHLPFKGGSSLIKKQDAATPWLGWDFAASNDTNTGEVKKCSSAAAVATTIPTTGGETMQNDEDTKAEQKDASNNDHEGDKWIDRAGEEPKMNRAYEGADNDTHGASVNKIIAFQTDRVVRLLDDMF